MHNLDNNVTALKDLFGLTEHVIVFTVGQKTRKRKKKLLLIQIEFILDK